MAQVAFVALAQSRGRASEAAAVLHLPRAKDEAALVAMMLDVRSFIALACETAERRRLGRVGEERRPRQKQKSNSHDSDCGDKMMMSSTFSSQQNQHQSQSHRHLPHRRRGECGIGGEKVERREWESESDRRRDSDHSSSVDRDHRRRRKRVERTESFVVAVGGDNTDESSQDEDGNNSRSGCDYRRRRDGRRRDPVTSNDNNRDSHVSSPRTRGRSSGTDSVDLAEFTRDTSKQRRDRGEFFARNRGCESNGQLDSSTSELSTNNRGDLRAKGGSSGLPSVPPAALPSLVGLIDVGGTPPTPNTLKTVLSTSSSVAVAIPAGFGLMGVAKGGRTAGAEMPKESSGVGGKGFDVSTSRSVQNSGSLFFLVVDTELVDLWSKQIALSKIVRR